MKFASFGIIGYGHFGQFMARSFAHRSRASILVTDIDESKLPKRANGIRRAALPDIAVCDVVVLAVPFAALEDALKGLRDHVPPETVVMDAVSTKALSTDMLVNILGEDREMLATHPLFGPPSMKRMRRGQRLIVTRTQGDRAEAFTRHLEKKFGLKVHRMSPEQHDRTMAYMQALPFFIARALMDLDILDLEYQDILSLPSFERLASIAAIERHHTEGMFDTSQRSNPYASGARQQFIEVLEKLNTEIGQGQVTSHPRVHADPSTLQPDLPFPGPTPTRQLSSRTED